MRIAYSTALIILILGGLGLGFSGLFGVDFLGVFAGGWITSLVYTAVGVAAVIVAIIAARTALKTGPRETRPKAAQPPEGGTPMGRTESTRAGDTPREPARSTKEPADTAKTGAVGTGPSGSRTRS